MEISKILSTPLPRSNVADSQIDLLNRLQQLGSIPARVLSIDNGQALLSTRLGEITGNNALNLKKGDVVQVRLAGDNQNPVLKISTSQTQSTLLPANKFPKILSILQSTTSATAFVVKQQGNSTLVQLRGSQASLPLTSQHKVGQLLNIKNNVNTGVIEIKPVNHEQVLKSALSQSIHNKPQLSTDNKLLPLLQMLKTSVKASSGVSAQASPLTTSQIQTGINSAMATPDIPKTMITLISGLQALTRSLPTIATLDQRTIQKWIQHITQSSLSDKTAKGALPTTNPLSVLHQLPKGEQNLSQLFQILMKPDQTQENFKVNQLKKTGADNVEPTLMQFREAVKSGEQSINQQLFQQVSLRLQQEFQQPIAFNLNLPFTEHQTVKSLKLKIRQKNKNASPENQAWEIKLSFEFGLLGLISTHIVLDGDTLSTNFWADKETTKVKIDNAIPEFKNQLIKNGFNLGSFFCYPGKPSNADNDEFNPMPDSLLDIKV